MFCDACTQYRLLCRDLHDKNSIIRVRVCRQCFTKHRNDRARNTKRKSESNNPAAAASPPTDRSSKQTAQYTKTNAGTIKAAPTPTNRPTKPATPSSASRTVQTVTVSKSPAAKATPKRSSQLDSQIARLNDGESGSKNALAVMMRKEVAQDDRDDREEEHEEVEEEEEDGEEGEEDEEEEEEEEGEESIEEGEEEEELVEEADEEEHEIMSIPSDSLATVKHSTASPVQQRPASRSAASPAAAASSAYTFNALTPRAKTHDSKETVSAATPDKETRRSYSGHEGRGEERLTEASSETVRGTPRSSQAASQQTTQQTMPVVQSSEYSRKPPTPSQPAPSSPSVRQQSPSLYIQTETPRSAAKLPSTPRSSITPQAAKVFAALARSTPSSANQQSNSAALTSGIAQPSFAQSLSGSVIVPSWPPVAEDHLMAVRGHVVEASTVMSASPLLTTAEEIESSATQPSNNSLAEQSVPKAVSTPSRTSRPQSAKSPSPTRSSTHVDGLLSSSSPTATGQVAAPPPAFSSSATAATSMRQRSPQKSDVQVYTLNVMRKPAFQPKAHTFTDSIAPALQSPKPSIVSPYQRFLQPVPFAVSVFIFIMLCAIFPLLYTVPATLVLATTVPLLYSWLYEKKTQAEVPLDVKRDFPQLVEVRDQLLEKKRNEEFEHEETERLSRVLPSPTLAKDYASQSEVGDLDEEGDHRSRVAPEARRLVV